MRSPSSFPVRELYCVYCDRKSFVMKKSTDVLVGGGCILVCSFKTDCFLFRLVKDPPPWIFVETKNYDY